MNGTYRAGLATNTREKGDDYDDRPSSMMTNVDGNNSGDRKHHAKHRHSNHEGHRHSNHEGHRRHSNHEGHRHSNHGHHHHSKTGHRHSHQHQDVSRMASPKNSGTSSPTRDDIEFHPDTSTQQDRAPSPGLNNNKRMAHSLPPTGGTTQIQATNQTRLNKSTPLPAKHDKAFPADTTGRSVENKPVNDISGEKEAIAVPVIAVAPVVVEDTVDASPNIPVRSLATSDEPRQGGLCCNCCCDYRRAVIIVNIVVIILEAIVLVLAATGMLDIYVSGGSDGSGFEDYEKMEMIFSAVSIVMCIIAIAGAYLYSSVMVGLNILWLVVGYILGIIFALSYCNDLCDDYDSYYYSCTCSVSAPALIAAGVATCCWIYPHVGFIYQVEQGILSKDTYAREEYSCCCV